MAKGKSANPADAFRKAQRKKELKKNKTERAKARDFALVKKDTWDLEDEIQKLEAADSNADKSRLNELKDELEKINKKKEEYVAEHPEHRKLVFKARKRDGENEPKEEAVKPQSRNLFNKHGLPRHPERSIYYDPVLNPYGVPPPGMPYVERPLRPDEMANEHMAEEDVSDEDIIMPEGPPPGYENEEEVDSDDDIPMPGGPPPSKDGDVRQPPLPPLPSGMPPIPSAAHFPPPSAFYGTSQISTGIPPPPPPPGLPPVGGPIPLPPLGFPMPPFPPLAPTGFPVISAAGLPLPPPPGFIPNQHQLPPPPPGFFSRRNQSISSLQDPLTSIPHQTFQAHRSSRVTGLAHPSLPPKPSDPSSQIASSAAVVSAEPQLRDLKKESTAFVPAALKRKKGITSNTTFKINAAPSVGPAEDSGPAPAPRPDLLSTLKNQFGTATSSSAEIKTKEERGPTSKSKDDYDKFLDEMGDILGPRPT